MIMLNKQHIYWFDRFQISQAGCQLYSNTSPFGECYLVKQTQHISELSLDCLKTRGRKCFRFAVSINSRSNNNGKHRNSVRVFFLSLTLSLSLSVLLFLLLFAKIVILTVYNINVELPLFLSQF